jgi:translocation and assembly module TamB
MRRPVRITLRVLGVIFLLCVALVGAVLIGGNTDPGRRYIERLTYQLTGGMVHLAGLGGSFPTDLTLDELQLHDSQGVWLSANHIAVSWHPTEMLRWHVDVDALQADKVHMERAPVSDGNPSSGKTSMPFIEVGQFSLKVVELGAPLVGTAASFSANGKMQMRSLEDAAGDLVARRTDGAGDYSLHLLMDSKHMNASLAVHEPASGPLENLLSVPGLGALAADAKLDGPRNAGRLTLVADAGDVHARISGTLDLVHIAAELEYSLTSPALAPRPEVAWDALSIKGNWHGDLKTAHATGDLRVDNLRIVGGTRLQHLKADLAASGGMLNVHAVVDGLEIPGSTPRLFADKPLTADGSIRLNDPAHPMDVTASHALLSLRGHAVTEKAGLRATVELKVPEVAPFAAVGSQNVRGSATVNGEVTTNHDTTSVTLDAALSPIGGTAPWIRYVGPHPTVKLEGSFSEDGIKLPTLRVSADALTATASGSATRVAAANFLDSIKDLQAKWQVDVGNLGLISPEVAGSATLSGTLSGSPKSLGVDAEASTKLSVRGSEPGAVQAKVHLRGLPKAPSGTIQAGGTVDGAPLSVDAAIDRTGDKAVRLLVHHADWKSAHVEGDATTDMELTQSHGQLQLKLGDLGDLNNLLGTKLAGSVEGHMGFVPVRGHTEARLELDGKSLVVGPVAGDVHFQADGTSDALDLQLTAQLPVFYGAPATLSAGAKFDLDAHELTVAKISADYRNEQFRLLSPAKLSFANGVAVDDLKLGAQEAVFEVAGQLSPQFDLHASLTKVHAGLVNVFSPGLMSGGTIEAQARLQGSPSSPTGNVTLDAKNITFADDAATGLPPVNVHAGADLAGDTAAVKASLTAGSGSELSASGSVPLNATGAFDLKMGGKLDVGLVNPLLEARGLRAAGTLTVDASVTGNSDAPQVAGGIDLSGGSIRDYAHGVNLSEITAQISGNQGGLQIKTFTAKAAAGTVSVTGTFEILEKGMPLDLHLIAKRAQPVASSIFTATVDGDLHVSGTVLQRLDVVGKLNVDKANIGIPDSLPPDVVVLDVRRRGQHVVAASSTKLVIGLDVTVDAPQQILVQGRGLDAELGGQIKVSGTTDEPQVSGGFNLQRGSFTIAGNRLDLITPGSVSFDGAGLRKKIDPALDFKAQSQVNDVTVTLNITGVADAPKFDFTSSPERPPDEIMALLLFGVPAAQLTALQIAQVGAALATLSGVGGSGSNPLVKIQKSLGLDRLSVSQATTTTATGATENSGAAIAAGRYVSKRVYVEGKQSTTGTSQVEVDVDLTKHLKLQTRLGNGTATTQGTTPENDPGSSVGLSYQFEY